MNKHPSWCIVCQQGPTRSLGALHSWCTNCGALYGEHGPVMPTKIGPSPAERRAAWDEYAAAVRSTPAAAALHADELMRLRDERFCGVAQSAEQVAVNHPVAGSSPALAAKEK